MKRKLKAFTLIELIIVMAIFGILMAGLMNFFKPIRETYVDSTLYEKQRTAQNGIAEYLCESTKYAEKMTIVDQGATTDELKYKSGSTGAETKKKVTVSDAKDAVTAFKYENYPDYETLSADEKDKIDSKIRVICINRSDKYDKVGKNSAASTDDSSHWYSGRIITNVLVNDADIKDDGTFKPTATPKINAMKNFDEKGSRTYMSSSSSAYTYMALGGAYYGESDYIISVKSDEAKFSSKENVASLTFTISNAFDNSSGVVKNGGDGVSINNDGSAVRVTTTNSNIMKNISSKVKYYVNGTAAGSLSDTGSIQNADKNTYIVFVVPDEGDR